MRFGLVGNLITHARTKRERSSVLEFGPQFTVETVEDVAFDAPVIRVIVGRALDHPDADVAEMTRPPDRAAALSRVLGGFDAFQSVTPNAKSRMFIYSLLSYSRSCSNAPRRASRARDSLDITVPIGIPAVSATSR